jgi:hypothetical protein
VGARSTALASLLVHRQLERSSVRNDSAAFSNIIIAELPETIQLL